MPPRQVTCFQFSADGSYDFYPTITSKDKKWNSRNLSDSDAWLIKPGNDVVIDLVSAGFKEGEEVFAGISIVSGKDVTMPNGYIVCVSSRHMAFSANGTAQDASLKCIGMYWN